MLLREQHYVPTVWLLLRSLPGSDMRSRSRIPSCLMLRFSGNWSLFHSVRGAPSKFLQALQCWRESITRGFDKDGAQKSLKTMHVALTKMRGAQQPPGQMPDRVGKSISVSSSAMFTTA